MAEAAKPKRQILKAGIAIVLAIVAIAITVNGLKPTPQPKVRMWFYDTGTAKLFPMENDMLPPLAAPSGAKNGVRAMVFSCGDTKDPATFKIAWLESFTPEFQAEYQSYSMLADLGPEAYKGGRLVRTPDDKTWHDAYDGSEVSQQAQLIPECPDGSRAKNCVP